MLCAALMRFVFLLRHSRLLEGPGLISWNRQEGAVTTQFDGLCATRRMSLIKLGDSYFPRYNRFGLAQICWNPHPLSPSSTHIHQSITSPTLRLQRRPLSEVLPAISLSSSVSHRLSPLAF